MQVKKEIPYKERLEIWLQKDMHDTGRICTGAYQSISSTNRYAYEAWDKCDNIGYLFQALRMCTTIPVVQHKQLVWKVLSTATRTRTSKLFIEENYAKPYKKLLDYYRASTVGKEYKLDFRSMRNKINDRFYNNNLTNYASAERRFLVVCSHISYLSLIYRLGPFIQAITSARTSGISSSARYYKKVTALTAYYLNMVKTHYGNPFTFEAK